MGKDGNRCAWDDQSEATEEQSSRTAGAYLWRLLADVPLHDRWFGRALYEFVRATRVQSILELGTGHGASACWLALGLATNGGGRLTTIDRRSAAGPSADELLEHAGLSGYVSFVRARRSYTWELMRLIEDRTVDGRCVPIFDFCVIDGEHNWDTDGLSFFLAEKLLQPGGWMAFDDLTWTFATSESQRYTEAVLSMLEEERSTPQIGKVFDLLVRQHPAFGEFRDYRGRGWARKLHPGDVGNEGCAIDSVHEALTSEL